MHIFIDLCYSVCCFSYIDDQKINVHHFADDILKANFVIENWCIFIQISHPQTFIFKDTVNNVSTLFQKMGWCRTGDKPLYQPIMVYNLPTHILVCVYESSRKTAHPLRLMWWRGIVVFMNTLHLMQHA